MDSVPIQDVLQKIIGFEMKHHDIKNLSVSLVSDQKVVWEGGFGLLEKETSVTPETIFRFGSISKLFTDIALMQLVEQGKIELDEPVSKYLPSFQPTNPFKTDILIRHLLSHSSGLVREPPVGHYFDETETSLTVTVDSLNKTTLLFEPGTKFKYSNAALAVVGRVLEAVTNEKFEDYIQTSLLNPLGMSQSSFAKRSDMTPLSRGHMWAYDRRSQPAPTFDLGEGPAGCLYSSTHDLAKFMSMIFGGGHLNGKTILASTTLQQMLVPEIKNVALGFKFIEKEGKRLYGHSGAIYGFTSDLLFQVEDKVGVVVTANKDVVCTPLTQISGWCVDALNAQNKGLPLPAYPYFYEPIPHNVQTALRGSYKEADGEGKIDLLYQGPLSIGLGDITKPLLKLWTDSCISDLGVPTSGKPNQIGTVGSLEGDNTIEYDLTNTNQIIWNGKTYNKQKFQPIALKASFAPLLGEYGPDYNTAYFIERDGSLYILVEWFFFDKLTETEDPNTFLFENPRSLYIHEKVVFHWSEDKTHVSHVEFGGVVFKRRLIGIDSEQTFTITPIRDIPEIRQEAMTMNPPKAKILGEEAPVDLVDLKELDPSIKYDLRYAGTNNFMQTKFYLAERALLQRPAAEALVKAHQKLASAGLGILVFDTYRPWFVTHCFWEATPVHLRHFVAPSATGSIHNRGCAADIGMYYLDSGEPVHFGGGFDEMSDRSYSDYIAWTSNQRYYRSILREAMEDSLFSVYIWEWWHFDYKTAASYPICNVDLQ